MVNLLGKKFVKHNYVIHDVIRPIFWDNSEIFWWYKQNMVLVAPESFEFNFTEKVVPMRNIVHYELFENKTRSLNETLRILNEIHRGKKSNSFYIKLLLYSLFGFDFVQKIKLLLIK